MEFVFVLSILFITIVLPLWLILHYITKWRGSRGLSAEDERMLADLWQSAKRMEERVVTLEAILDAESPHWRKKV
jgi:phage shock protein B